MFLCPSHRARAFGSIVISLLMGATLEAQLPTPRAHMSVVSPVDATIPGRVSVHDTRVAPPVVDAGGFPCAPRLAPGWPVRFPGDTRYGIDPMRGVAFADLDSDGRAEIIRPSTDGQLRVWNRDGSRAAGFPQPLIGLGQEAPAVVDVDADGRPEIVVATRGRTAGGALHVFTADGRQMPGWPRTLGGGNSLIGAPLCVDLDRDGDLEILAQERIAPVGGRLHAFHHDGQPYGNGFPYDLDHLPAGSPAAADLDGDGVLEIVTISFRALHAIDANARPLAGFPIDVARHWGASFSYQSPAIGDIDGDGLLDIVVACHGAGAGCYAFSARGATLLGWPFTFGGTWTFAPPSIVDLDRDGRLDVVVGQGGQALAGNVLHALDGRAQPLRGFPIAMSGGSEAPLAIADLDGDGRLEIVFDSNLRDAGGAGYLHCVDDRGRPEVGWPLSVPGFTHLNGAQLGDVDGDGALELCAVSRTSTQVAVSLFELPCAQLPQPAYWSSYQGGPSRAGLAGGEARFELRGHATPGGLLWLAARGTPLASWIALAAAGPGRQRLSSSSGVLLLDPASTVQLVSGFLQVNGEVSRPYALPNDPALRGAEVYLQGGVFEGGTLQLGAMRRVRVR